MQNTLLSIGLALIVAIVTAFAAPLFVDWNVWRSIFEQRASALVGAPVVIKGSIDAAILPIPAFTLRDVTIGESEEGTGLKAAILHGRFSLGALMRGSVEAEELFLSNANIRISLDDRGKIKFGTSAQPISDSILISRIEVKSGLLVITRTGVGETRYENFTGTGELQSRTGPLKLDASATWNGQPIAVHASSGQFGVDGSGKIRLAVSWPDDNSSLVAEGNLSLTDAFPQFSGKLLLEGRSPSNLPWKLAANAKANLQTVALEQLEVSLGDEPAIELSGNANFEPRKGGTFDAKVSSSRIDLDRPRDSGKLAQDLSPLNDLWALATALPFAGKIGVSIGQIAVNGGTVRDFRLQLLLREGFVAPEMLEAKLPGRGSVNVTGSVNDAAFSGSMKITAEDAFALSNWLGLEKAGISFDQGGPASLEGRLQASKKQLSLEPLNLTYAGSKMGGAAAYLFPDRDRRARVAAKLDADALDLRLFASLLQRPRADFPSVDLMFALKVLTPKLFGQTARRFDVSFSEIGGEVSLERLTLEDFAGLNARANGHVASFFERPAGKINFALEATRAEGLNVLVGAMGGTGDGAAYAKRIVSAGLPLRLEGTMSGDGLDPRFALEVAGNANETQQKLDANVDIESRSIVDAHLTIDARDASRIVSLLGLPAPEMQAGQGHFEGKLEARKNDARPIGASLTFPSVKLTAEGDIRLTEDGRAEPRVTFKLQSSDVRALSIAAARVSNSVVPTNAVARLVRTNEGIALEDVILNFGEIRAKGRFALSGVDRPQVSGEMSFNHANLPTLFALAIGKAEEGAPWPDRALGPRPFGNLSGTLQLESAAFGLTGPLVANGARLKLKFDPDQAIVEEFSGDLAGGRLSAQGRLVRGDALSLAGKVSIVSADIARLIAPGSWRSAAHGKVTLTIDLAGQGANPASLAANLAGQGKFSVEAFEIERLDPDALDKVLAFTANVSPPDELSTSALLNKAMARGPLKITKIEGPIVVAAGVARSGKLKAAVGPTQVISEAIFDISKLELDAAFEFEGAAPKGMSARPAATVRWRGPLSEPERSIDAGPLVVVLALRAMDIEMRKLDGRDRPPSAQSSATETSLVPVPTVLPAAPLPRKRPSDPASSIVPVLPPPIDIGPAPGSPRPTHLNQSLQ